MTSRPPLHSRLLLFLLIVCCGLCSATASKTTMAVPTRVAVVGGGLAGLSVSYHLSHACHVTIIDPCRVGCGGASAVAGGLVHPLSPRGKLVHWGLESLKVTNDLIQISRQFEPNAVLADRLLRLAVSVPQVETLRRTCAIAPHLAQWREGSECPQSCQNVLGAVALSNGCCVLHVPTYLQGLWKATQQRAVSHGFSAEWQQTDTVLCVDDTTTVLSDCDAVVLCGGAGMMQQYGLVNNDGDDDLPVQLVGGHSVILNQPCDEAVLCGKYVSPCLDPSHTLIGSTHEFKTLDTDSAIQELKERTASFYQWDAKKVVDTTYGVRVQSHRPAFGRRPIVGRHKKNDKYWIFTGLSSRGILYHGLYGQLLADAVLQNREEVLLERDPKILWWKK